jgi:DNA primase small subunit
MFEEGFGNSLSFIKNQFKNYYKSLIKDFYTPPNFQKREFGFLSFEGRNMMRHISFDEPAQLKSYLLDLTPAHVYFSSAYYEKPSATMEKKDWVGADLVFDIDADHFELSCRNNHDRWTCKKCGKEGSGPSPEKCPSCADTSFKEEKWICKNCLEAAKHETQKLLDILIQDFGFQDKEGLSVNFSGNRGYHVHVKNPSVKELDQISRREVVDYIMGLGIKASFQGFTSNNNEGPPLVSQGGWRSRSLRALYDFINDSKIETFENIKIRKTIKNEIIEKKEELLKILIEGNPREIIKFVDKSSLDKIMEVAVWEQAAKIDTVVTTDLHRLIRLPNSLHGKSSWICQPVSLDKLPEYSPLTSAVAFKEGRLRLYVKRTPKIFISGEYFGPFEEERIELPMSVSMYLLCKRAARVEP